MRVNYGPSFPRQLKGVTRRAIEIMRPAIEPLMDVVLFSAGAEADSAATAASVSVQLAYRQANVTVLPLLTEAYEYDEDEQVRVLVHEMSHILTAAQAEIVSAFIERIEPNDGPARKLLINMGTDAMERDTQAVARALLVANGMKA